MNKIKIAVFVDSGCVTSIVTNHPDEVEAIIVDSDVLEDERDVCETVVFEDGESASEFLKRQDVREIA